MNYEELQAEKGLPCGPPRVRRRSLSNRRHRNYYITCVAIITLWIFTPIRHLTRPFFATYFFHYPVTTFNAAEIASLTTEFYEILSKMGQFPPETIKYPPQNPPINANFAKSLGMAPQVIDLLERLPYVEGNDRAWLYDAEFADFRYKDQLEQSRDPFHVKPDGWSYYSERGPYLRPWQVALNAMGDHGVVFLLDTWTNRISLTNQLCGCSKDPKLEHTFNKGTWSKNVNAWEHLPSRHAPELLRDFIEKFRKLEWLPAEYTPYSKPSTTIAKELYLANGWPDNFNLTSFEAAKARSANYTRGTWEQEKPVYLVKWMDNHIKELEQKIVQLKVKNLGLGPSDKNHKPPQLNSTTAHMVEVGEEFQKRIEKSKAGQKSETVVPDRELIKQEAKLAAAKEELRAAEQNMQAAGLSRESLPLGLPEVHQEATSAKQKFQQSHAV
ncbi:hypothetical protein ABVK25_011268 [Lepraria finkii]|uniref:Uncharacterized protein n=1 Tax=Lepraria finkii TaxID=1340010 RepID=A0ABR4AQS3_9LECA